MIHQRTLDSKIFSSSVASEGASLGLPELHSSRIHSLVPRIQFGDQREVEQVRLL